MDHQPSNAPEQKTNSAGKIIAAIVIIIIALLVGFFIFIGNDSNQSTEMTTNQTPQTTPRQDNNNQADEESSQPTADDEQSQNTITYTDDGFAPATLSVKVGDTVTVINRSSSSLQFSSDAHPTHTNNPEINQGTTAPGESTTFTVTEPGTHGYHDHLNSSRTGTLIVE